MFLNLPFILIKNKLGISLYKSTNSKFKVCKVKYLNIIDDWKTFWLFERLFINGFYITWNLIIYSQNKNRVPIK